MRVCIRTAIDFERGCVEEPAVEKRFEATFIERMCCFVDRDVSHIGLEPTKLDERSRMEEYATATTRGPQRPHPLNGFELVTERIESSHYVIFQKICYS